MMLIVPVFRNRSLASKIRWISSISIASISKSNELSLLPVVSIEIVSPSVSWKSFNLYGPRASIKTWQCVAFLCASSRAGFPVGVLTSFKFFLFRSDFVRKFVYQ